MAELHNFQKLFEDNASLRVILWLVGTSLMEIYLCVVEDFDFLIN